jgi:hypothetical protein
MLSEELTAKHKEIQKVERTKLDQERELLQLRPLKDQLKSFDQQNRSQIETNVQMEFDRQKMAKQVLDL